MLKHDVEPFYRATVALGMNRIKMGDMLIQSPHLRDKTAKLRETNTVVTSLVEVADGLRTLNLAFVLVAVERLSATLNDPGEDHTWGWLEEELRQLEIRMQDCLGSTYLLSLDAAEAAFYEPKVPHMSLDFGERFGAANQEINEAAKCLGLGLDTAAAFHSLRSLEAGMRAMSRCLGIPDAVKGSERNWGVYLRNIKIEMDKRWPAAQRMLGDGEFFENAYAALAAMQNPWRNATMHLDQNYQRDQAKRIFEAVKGFMAQINARMDENGEPKV